METCCWLCFSTGLSDVLVDEVWKQKRRIKTVISWIDHNPDRVFCPLNVSLSNKRHNLKTKLELKCLKGRYNYPWIICNLFCEGNRFRGAFTSIKWSILKILSWEEAELQPHFYDPSAPQILNWIDTAAWWFHTLMLQKLFTEIYFWGHLRRETNALWRPVSRLMSCFTAANEDDYWET